MNRVGFSTPYIPLVRGTNSSRPSVKGTTGDSLFCRALPILAGVTWYPVTSGALRADPTTLRPNRVRKNEVTLKFEIIADKQNTIFHSFLLRLIYPKTIGAEQKIDSILFELRKKALDIG